MTDNSLAQRVANSFNRHGKFTARPVEHNLAVQVRHADTGELASTVWLPDGPAGWMWFPVRRDPVFPVGVIDPEPRELDRKAGIDDLVRAVATSVLDEGAKR